MALGVLLAGLPRLGVGPGLDSDGGPAGTAGRRHNPDDFSFGYLLQMGVGVAVGIAVNLLVFPPLHFNAAALSLAELRLSLARQLCGHGGGACTRNGRRNTRTGRAGRRSWPVGPLGPGCRAEG